MGASQLLLRRRSGWKCSLQMANSPLLLLSGCWESPEVLTHCEDLEFAGQGQRKTPVADAKTLVQIILLLPRKTAANVRMEGSMVFVDFLGGIEALVGAIWQHPASANSRWHV